MVGRDCLFRYLKKHFDLDGAMEFVMSRALSLEPGPGGEGVATHGSQQVVSLCSSSSLGPSGSLLRDSLLDELARYSTTHMHTYVHQSSQ